MGVAVVGVERRGRAVSAMMAGLTIACAVGVPLTSVVGDTVGWRWSFVGVGVLGLVTLAALWAWTPSLPVAEGTTVRTEVAALRNRRLWIAFGAGAIGFGGMFAVYSYVKPLLTEVTGLGVGLVPVVLALYGIGMTIGTVVGGRLADRSVLGTVIGSMVATIVVLVVIALVGSYPVPAVLALVLLGVTSQVLGLSLQTRLMDVSPAAPSLGAALCHSALNLGNAAGAFVGGLVIAGGHGLPGPGVGRGRAHRDGSGRRARRRAWRAAVVRRDAERLDADGARRRGARASRLSSAHADLSAAPGGARARTAAVFSPVNSTGDLAGRPRHHRPHDARRRPVPLHGRPRARDRAPLAGRVGGARHVLRGQPRR